MSDEDLGLKYMRELKFKQARSISSFQNELKKKIGKEKAEIIIDALDYRSKNQLSKTVNYDGGNVYTLMNADYKTAMAFAGIHDESFYRVACNWLASRSEYITGNVLDVGCNNGIISCFIAKFFPNCHVTGIDREPAGIAVAKELAQKLGLNNIDFICTEINEYKPDSLFDTLIASRTLAENRKFVVPEPVTVSFLVKYKDAISEYRESLNGYAKVLSGLLNDDGNLVLVERIEDNEMMCGWVLSLKDNGICQKEELEELQANEVEGTSHNFSGVVFKKENSKKEDSEIVDDWFERKLADVDLTEQYHFHNEAQMMIEYYHFEQEDSVILVDPDDKDGDKLCVVNGYLYCPEKRLVQYSVNYVDGTKNKYRYLCFVDESGHDALKKDIENWTSQAFFRGLNVEKKYFGDPDR